MSLRDQEPPSSALFIGAMPHEAFKAWRYLIGWQPHRAHATAWENAGFKRVDHLPEKKFSCVVVLPGKSKEATFASFANAIDRLEIGGQLIVAMTNAAGASRYEKEIAKVMGQVQSFHKNKCRAFSVRLGAEVRRDIIDDWRLGNVVREIDGFLVLPGIFSSKQIDAGSRALVSHFPAGLRGTAADIGAGWGYLSHSLLERCSQISKVDLFEVDATALECAHINLTNFSRRVSFHWHDVCEGLPANQYDVVMINPPFHAGQALDLCLGRRMIEQSIQTLKPGGTWFAVANRQLPYEKWLDHCGMPARKLSEDGTYKCFTGIKPLTR